MIYIFYVRVYISYSPPYKIKRYHFSNIISKYYCIYKFKWKHYVRIF